MAKHVGYSALPIEQNKQRFYFATIPVQDLYPFCFVSRREEDAELGFQRKLNEGRAEDISKYLATGKGSIPTNIVLSAQPEAKLTYKQKLIKYERVDKAFLVLDGQHRLLGYHLCKEKYDKDLRVPVSIYEGLTHAEEARLFIDINTNQKGVPAALLLDIKQVAQTESKMEATLRSVFDRLNKEASSPLAGKMSPSKSSKGKINRLTFNRALEPVLRSGLIADLPTDRRYAVIINYLKAFEAEIDDPSLLTRSSFFEALFGVFNEVAQLTAATSGNLKASSIQNIIRPAAKIDFWSTGAGGLTKSSLIAAMRTALLKNVQISDEDV